MMKGRKRAHPMMLLAAGLFGISLYFIAYYQLEIALASDFAKGLWLGVCIGLELLGLFCVVKAKNRHAVG